MNTKVPYTYTVLRYVHDITSGEFVNVGVVVMSSENGTFETLFKTNSVRVKTVFPTLNGKSYRSRLLKMQSSFELLKRQTDNELPINSDKKLLELVHSVLPNDDSSLQWGSIGSGISSDLKKTATSLFERFVSKYDLAAHETRKEDADVWKLFKVELEKRNLIQHFVSKSIEVEDDDVEFEHAWKNGKWHCYEPLSFDLANSTSIRTKAHKWLGQMASLEGAREDFLVHFLVAKPSSPSLEFEYEKALSILRKNKLVQVVEEIEMPVLAEKIQKEIKEHKIIA